MWTTCHTHTHAHRHAHRRCRGLALLPGASSLHTQIWENRKMGKCGGGVKTFVGHCGNVLLLTVICSLCFHSFSSLASNNPMWVWLSPVNLPTLFFFILFLPLMSLCPPSGFYFYHTFLSFHLAPCLAVFPIPLISLLSQVVTDRTNRDTEGQRGSSNPGEQGDFGSSDL